MRKITLWSEVAVRIQWKRSPDAEGRRYAILRWTSPDGRDELPIGRVTQDQAEAKRSQVEARLRLRQPPTPPNDPTPSYSVFQLMCEYVSHTDQSRTSKEHKDRVVLDAESIIRHLGNLECDELARAHTLMYRDRRGQERTITVRRRSHESDDEWAERRAADRTSGHGTHVSSRVIRNEIATLRRAQAFMLALRRPAGVPVPLLRASDVTEDSRPPRRLTQAEVRALVEAAHALDSEANGLGWLIQAHAWSGRRPKALYHLRVADCERLVQLGLERHERLVWWEADKGSRNLGYAPITEPAMRAIVGRLRELGDAPGDTLVWTTAGGKRWTSSAFGNFWKRIRSASGVENVQLYDLRRHACARLASKLMPNVAIRFSGHSNPVTFAKTYAYAFVGSAEHVAGSLDWDVPELEQADARETA